MINNYRSRSFSFKALKRSKPSLSKPHPNFNPPHPEHLPSPYLPITYASPHCYYTNSSKETLSRLEYRLNRSLQLSRSPQLPQNTPAQQKQQHMQQHESEQGKASCLYSYFAKLCSPEDKKERKEEGEGRPKSKSILMIRRVTKRKEELAQHTKERLDREFRSKKQIPIHHTHFHFHHRKAKTQPSSPTPLPSPPHTNTDFSQKIHRAVEQILRLRASLKPYDATLNPYPRAREESVEAGVVEGQFSKPLHRREAPHFSWKCRPAAKRKTARKAHAAKEENEIGPWVRNPAEIDFLF